MAWRSRLLVGALLIALVAGGADLGAQTIETPRVEFVNQLALAGDVRAVATTRTHAYVASSRGLHVVGISDPPVAREISYAGIANGAWDVALVGGYAYVAAGLGGLRVFDLTSATAPWLVGTITGTVNAVAVSGVYAYATGERTVRIFDVRAPSAPVELGSHAISSFGFAATPLAVRAAGSYAYVTSSASTPFAHHSLHVLDVSDPSRPREVGVLRPSGEAWGLDVAGGYVYLAAGTGGLRVIDVSDPSRPRDVGAIALPGRANGVAVAGRYAFVAAGTFGLRVVDVDDPTRPTEAAFYDTPGNAQQVAVAGSFVLSANGDGGLTVVRFPASRWRVALPVMDSSSGFQVMGLGGGETALTLTYYNQNGSVAAIDSDAVRPFRTRTYYGPTLRVSRGFVGSVVISADQPIAAIANQLARQPTKLESYVGVADPQPTQYLPLVMRSNGGLTSHVLIQNVGLGAADDTRVEIYRAGQLVTNRGLPVIGPGATYVLDFTAVPELGDGFSGSARITSSQPLATVVNQRDGVWLFAYAGFAGGAPTLYVPLLMNDYYGWFTGLRVQNVGERDAVVELLISGRVVDTALLGPGGGRTWYPIPGTSAGFFGSAIVRTVGEGRIVGIVNEFNPTAGQGMTYAAFTRGTSRAHAPLVMRDNAGFSAGIQVQNVGPSATAVTLKIDGQPVDVALIPSGQSRTWYPLPGTSRGFVGSATVEAGAGGQIVAIVNQITDPQQEGDTSAAYNAFNE